MGEHARIAPCERALGRAHRAIFVGFVVLHEQCADPVRPHVRRQVTLDEPQAFEITAHLRSARIDRAPARQDAIGAGRTSGLFQLGDFKGCAAHDARTARLARNRSQYVPPAAAFESQSRVCASVSRLSSLAGKQEGAGGLGSGRGLRDAPRSRAARAAKNYDQAIALDTQATQGKPDSGLTWYELGDSYLGAKKYDDAVTNYKKALALLSAAAKPNPAVLAAANNNMGEALANSGKTTDAVAAYEAAAKVDPTQAGKYYSNEAIVLFKTGQGDPAGAAADKAIAADPNSAVPYYIKGWSLVQHATVDPKTSKIVLPPGCAEAYQKFLSMNPTGPLADDARSILDQSGETVQKSFKKH